MNERLANLLTFWIPISIYRRNLRKFIINKFNQYKIPKVHNNYKKIIKYIKKRVIAKEKINVAFFVIYDSIFPAESLFEQMINDDIFNPCIIVIPDISRGKKNMYYQMDKTYNTLSKKYKNVYRSFDNTSNSFMDVHKKFHMICTANPYDKMTYHYYQVNYFSKNCLNFYINYFYFGRTHYELRVAKSIEFNLFWKIFVENNNVKKILERENIKNSNLIVSGYIKMDEYKKYEKDNKRFFRKKILITPHHSIDNFIKDLSISNFLKYSDFFLELPLLYPQIDFIFRPHPLLFINLKNDKYWGKEKVDKYITKLKAIPNLTYQDGGSYMQTFAESDCIINDCGSFLAEYFYTGKPQCYMLNKNIDLNFNFLQEGIEMLNNTYKAYSKDDIINFIDNVILKEKDYMKEVRVNYAGENIKINYPFAANAALNYLKKEILT